MVIRVRTMSNLTRAANCQTARTINHCFKGEIGRLVGAEKIFGELHSEKNDSARISVKDVAFCERRKEMTPWLKLKNIRIVLLS